MVIMNNQQLITLFIVCLARKIAALYPSGCADEDDYIQVGHLKLAEINNDKYKKHNSQAYAIVAISRAIREAALGAMGAISAPNRIKRQIHMIDILSAHGQTEQEICCELKIDTKTLISLRLLIYTESWHRLFQEPTYDIEPFSIIDDILSSSRITAADKVFLRAQFDEDMDSLNLTRKQQWLRGKNLRPKLMRSGYGI